MARRRPAEIFPAPLARFRERDWGPVPGECLGRFACRAAGYEAGCVPGEAQCGALFYAQCPPGLVAAERRTDALYRWRQARMSWLGEDHPAWVDEFAAWLADA